MTGPVPAAASGGAESFEIAVAIMPRPASPDDWPELAAEGDAVPGFEDALGKSAGEHGKQPFIARKGEEALHGAIDAIAGQIGLIAQQIGAAIGASAQIPAQPGTAAFGIESVQVSFGVTLSAGLQTVFTSQAQSSAQVTLTLSRRE